MVKRNLKKILKIKAFVRRKFKFNAFFCVFDFKIFRFALNDILTKNVLLYFNDIYLLLEFNFTKIVNKYILIYNHEYLRFFIRWSSFCFDSFVFYPLVDFKDYYSKYIFAKFNVYFTVFNFLNLCFVDCLTSSGVLLLNLIQIFKLFFLYFNEFCFLTKWYSNTFFRMNLNNGSFVYIWKTALFVGSSNLVDNLALICCKYYWLFYYKVYFFISFSMLFLNLNIIKYLSFDGVSSFVIYDFLDYGFLD